MEAALKIKHIRFFVVVLRGFKVHPFKGGFDNFCGLVVCFSCLNG